MKLWFSGGAVVIVLMLYTAFCDQDLSLEINTAAHNNTMDVPCSLNGKENITDCMNATESSLNSTELWETSNSNSSEDMINKLCSSSECPVSYEPNSNTTSEISTQTALTNLPRTEHLTDSAIILSNETSTNIPCPPEGCPMNKPERNASEILPENTINHSTVILSNETFENNNFSESILNTNETFSNTSDEDKLTKELHDNSSLSNLGNISMTSEMESTIPTDSSNISSHSMGSNFSEEFHYFDNPSANTTLSSISTIYTEENDTIIDDNLFSAESNVTSTSNHFILSSEITYSAENITETSDILISSNNITDQEETNESLTIRPKNDSIDSISEFTTENVTVDDFFTTLHTTDAIGMNITTFDSNDVTSNVTFFPNSSDPAIKTTMWTVIDGNTNSSTDTSSESLVDITTLTSSESPLTPLPPHHATYLIVELKINCSGNNQEKEIALSVAQLLNATLKDSYNKGCSNLHNVTLSVSQDSKDFATVYKLLSEKLKNAELIRIIYDGTIVNATSKNITLSDSDVTQSEMILYITLGVCLGAVFLIALAIICFKCCRRHPSKPIDLDVPHLNLRLEDYTLTRIPRPNTVYLDYFRGPIVSDRYSTAPLGNSMNTATEVDRGLVQPFDTSVVPLEDAKKLDELATSPGRTSSTCPSTPLRTFGRKDWKRGDNLIYENVISSSTEKLHPDFYKYGYPGMENPTFAA